MRGTARLSPRDGGAAENPAGSPPMPTLRATIRTLATTGTVLAGATLLSGWLSVALAGGGRWTG